MNPKPASHDEYLASVEPVKREALERLRAQIREIVPDSEECISYGMPAFKKGGKAFAGYAAFKNHCTYFPHSGGPIATLGDDLKGYGTSKGAVQFAPEAPLPRALVSKLIDARMKEIASSGK